MIRAIRYAASILFAVLLMAGTVGNPARVQAHIGTIGYSEIRAADHTLSYTLHLEAREVEQWVTIRSRKTVVIDPDSTAKPDGPSWTDSDLLRMIGETLEVTADGQKGRVDLKASSVDKKNGIDMLTLQLEYPFPKPVGEYKVNYHFFYDLDDPQHQNFVTLWENGKQVQRVFNKDLREIKLTPSGAEQTTAAASKPEKELSSHAKAGGSWTITFRDFFVTGVRHIWTGYDHLLFLLGLLILKQSTKAYIRIVSAFTVGHSVTLALAALDIVRAPLSVIEPLIALSIVFIAVENLWFKRHGHRWLIALGFGFIHGFGFADILHGALGEHYLSALLSFNLGVEAGQLVVLGALLPLLLYLRRVTWYPRVLYAASGLIALMGTYWFIGRIAI
ncbi:HupE/UreJ family protein [Paenibacillus aurantius]|uniref:HupE/UreJ family protein n=1 Tax=Paenibacillus aurantius TaxID=2918900 RepID=A0AA96LB04_9BACL|nr:HupE/UreJ family protein [Paenibacillus aurantius]WNQ10479.1 HupE/UreJ family protein [Paenibacillus aurantius]